MNIAYFAEVNAIRRKGVIDKLADMGMALRAAGAHIKFFIVTGEDAQDNEFFRYFSFSPLGSLLGGYIRKHFLYARIQAAISAFAPDVMIVRDTVFSPLVAGVIRKYKVVFELNSNAVKEFREKYGWAHYAIKMTLGLLYRKASGFICVTKEISSLLYITRYKKPVFVSGNGIDCSRIRFLKYVKQPSPQIFFIGSPSQVWHGIDKVLYLAEQLPRYKFHIVGPDNVPSCKNIKSYGYVNEEKRLQDIVSQCDAGIGTLSLYHKGMNEACPLKVRFYLAAGLPAILGYQDTDISDKYDFVLQIENRPDNIKKNIGRIKEFVENLRMRPEIRSQARTFAESNLDVQKKELLKLKFLQAIVKTRD